MGNKEVVECCLCHYNIAKYFPKVVISMCENCQVLYCKTCSSKVLKKGKCRKCGQPIIKIKRPTTNPFQGKNIINTNFQNQTVRERFSKKEDLSKQKRHLKMGTKIFISYAIKDSEHLKIPQIANALKGMENIDEVYFFEGWDGFPNGNIVEFMEMGIIDCDAFIPVFTKESINSYNCRKERDMAIFQNKRIIPLFESFDLVPLACQPYKGLNLTGKSIKEILLELYNLITYQLHVSNRLKLKR